MWKMINLRLKYVGDSSNILEFHNWSLKFLASHWVPETSKVLWEILVVSLRPKFDDVSVSWTYQRYTYKATSEGGTRHLVMSSTCYFKTTFKKKVLISCCFGLFDFFIRLTSWDKDKENNRSWVVDESSSKLVVVHGGLTRVQ